LAKKGVVLFEAREKEVVAKRRIEKERLKSMSSSSGLLLLACNYHSRARYRRKGSESCMKRPA